jgi:hypothetical protein
MHCKVINLFISKPVFLLTLLYIIIIFILFAIVIMIINGVCCADQIMPRKMEGKNKVKKSKTTRFHIHTDNPVDELSNR